MQTKDSDARRNTAARQGRLPAWKRWAFVCGGACGLLLGDDIPVPQFSDTAARLVFDPVNIRGRPFSLQEATAALEDIRNYRPRLRNNDYLHALSTGTTDGTLDETLLAAHIYGSLVDKLHYDREQCGDELRVIYAILAGRALADPGTLPQDMAALQVPSGMDAGAYRLLGVTSAEGLAHDVLLCMRRMPWLLDGSSINDVYAWDQDDGERLVRLPYAQFLARREADGNLQLAEGFAACVPSVVVLMGDGRVKCLHKPELVELLAKDAAMRTELGIAPVPADLLQETFGDIDERIYTLVPKDATTDGVGSSGDL